jgi:hypothetical protein
MKSYTTDSEQLVPVVVYQFPAAQKVDRGDIAQFCFPSVSEFPQAKMKKYVVSRTAHYLQRGMIDAQSGRRFTLFSQKRMALAGKRHARTFLWFSCCCFDRASCLADSLAKK